MPVCNDENELILQKAQQYLLFEAGYPMLWTVAGVTQDIATDGGRRWTIAVHIRYPTGHEGYLGDLAYDGNQFTQLTDPELMRQRAKTIATDPEGKRAWDELNNSTLQAGKA